VTAFAGADDRARPDIERGEQVERAVAAVVVGVPLGLARPHRERRRGTLRRLDLRLLVHAEHQRALGWCEIEPDDVAHLLDEGRVGRELEGLRPVRTQAERAPDARDRGLAHPGAAGHRPRAPVRGALRRLLQRQRDQALDRLIIDGPRCSGARRVHEPLQPVPGEAPAPGRRCLAADAQRRGHAQIGRARLGAGEHDPDALRESLAHATPAQQAPQLGALGLR
jgi:hypothetical protein